LQQTCLAFQHKKKVDKSYFPFEIDMSKGLIDGLSMKYDGPSVIWTKAWRRIVFVLIKLMMKLEEEC